MQTELSLSMGLPALKAVLIMQVRKLSVKAISSPLLFDTTGRPADNGLYDLAMGPMEPGDVYVLPPSLKLHSAVHCMW